jgi:signal transduction histidine kinase
VPDFDRAVSLACHDLRTPLATVTGFAKTLLRTGELDERSYRYIGMIDGAADQLAALLEELGLLARIEGGRYEPGLVGADTLELAGPGATGSGTQIETDAPALRRALAALAVAAARHGGIERTGWTVDGRRLELAPVNADAAPIVLADDPRDFGALVARCVIEALGGSLELEAETLKVLL